MRQILAIVLMCYFSSTAAQTLTNGQFKPDSSQLVWDVKSANWVTPEQFWQNYVAEKGGLTWAKSAQYPEYDRVKERDTFLVELDSGTCLMEFFHQRWRRANDVVRWDTRFNQYGGCADVFK